MGDFLDKADELRRVQADGVRKSGSSFENVFSAISELQGVYAKSFLDLDNIEALFGAIEMGVLLDKLAQRDSAAIKALRDDLVTLIYTTLETCIHFPVSKRGIEPPPPYPQLVEVVRGCRERPSPVELGFITFNYDLVLDFALHWARVPCSYGITGLPGGTVPLLKLHGSINWGACAKCGEIVPFKVRDAHFNLLGEERYVRYNLGSSLPQKSHCEAPLPLPPVIVPPTWNKTAYHGQLSAVWRSAAGLLAEAESIFVVGYSLPETDSFFRYLFALGSESRTRIKRLWVFDPDPTQEVEQRFRDMIGRGIENRFKFFRVKFSEAVPTIQEALNAT